MALCSVVAGCQCFIAPCYLHLQGKVEAAWTSEIFVPYHSLNLHYHENLKPLMTNISLLQPPVIPVIREKYHYLVFLKQ